MADNSNEYDNVIRKPSRYAGDLHRWLDFAPDGSFESDIIADQLDALSKAFRQSFPTAEEAVSAFCEVFAADFDTPPKAKGD